MLSPIASEAIFSATYVDSYIDSVENLPNDVQRQLSRIREIDVQYRGCLRDVDHFYDLWQSLQHVSDASNNRKLRAASRMQQCLIQAQELGDEKMQIVNQLQELIDHKTRQLNTDQRNLDIKEELQQHYRAGDSLQQLQDECGLPTPLKLTRTQSPMRADQTALTGIGSNVSGGGVSERHNTISSFTGGKDHNSNSFSGFAGGSISSGGGSSTPNSERSGNGGAATSSNLNSVALGNELQQRSVNKRARRRNDTTGSLILASNSNNIEIGGNESNCANETAINNERNVIQKTTGVGSTQKKNVVQTGVGSTTNVISSGTAGAGVGAGGSNSSGKKKKRKARGAQSSTSLGNTREETPPPDPIDPDEPTYCVCNQISFGEMILCDNDLCPIEWFHFSCVSLVLKPKGKWYCPNCRGDRPNVMKPKAQFLKELERYNKEKEEKT